MNSAGEGFILMESDIKAGWGMSVADFVGQDVLVDAIGPVFSFTLAGVLVEVAETGRAIVETSAGVVRLPSGRFVITGSRDGEGRIIITIIGK